MHFDRAQLRQEGNLIEAVSEGQYHILTYGWLSSSCCSDTGHFLPIEEIEVQNAHKMRTSYSQRLTIYTSHLHYVHHNQKQANK